MKTTALLTTTLICLFISSYSSGLEQQSTETLSSPDSLNRSKKKIAPVDKKKVELADEKKIDPAVEIKMKKQPNINPRISFIFGAGAAVMLSTIYEEPVIDKATSFVKINKGSPLKTSISLGIVYTPFLWTVDGEKDIAKGISYALFISPTTIGTIGNNLVKTNVDAGFGIGYRTVGGFSVFGVVDFFSLRNQEIIL